MWDVKMQGARCADVRCEGAKCEDVSYEDVKSQLLFWKNPTHRRSRELGGEVTKYCSAWGLHRSKMLLERHRYVAQTLRIRCNTQKARDAQAVGLEICQCKQFPSSQCIQKLVLHVQVSQLCLFFVPRKVVAKSSHFKDVSLHQNARPCLSSSATSWQSPPQVGSPQATTSPCIAIRRKNPNEP